MTEQAAFTTVSYSDLLAHAVGLDSTEILWGPSTATGTHVWLRQGRIWKAFLISDLLASINASGITGNLPFSQVSAGIGATDRGVYELASSTGGVSVGAKYIVPQQTSALKNDAFDFRKTSDQSLVNAMKFTSTNQITLGDALYVLQFAATLVINGGVPWRTFGLDTTLDAGSVLGEMGVDQSQKTNPRWTSQDSGSAVRQKSITILWETGSFAGDAINKAYAQTFTNAQKDAAYFVVIETDDGNTFTTTNNSDVTSKTNTGFTVEFPAILPVAVTVRWYAVRYSV